MKWKDVPTQMLDVVGVHVAYWKPGSDSGVSVDTARRLPNSGLTIYLDSGHGGVFQHDRNGVAEVLDLLAD